LAAPIPQQGRDKIAPLRDSRLGPTPRDQSRAYAIFTVAESESPCSHLMGGYLLVCHECPFALACAMPHLQLVPHADARQLDPSLFSARWILPSLPD
jgi:hypothetical protein